MLDFLRLLSPCLLVVIYLRLQGHRGATWSHHALGYVIHFLHHTNGVIIDEDSGISKWGRSGHADVWSLARS